MNKGFITLVGVVALSVGIPMLAKALSYAELQNPQAPVQGEVLGSEIIAADVNGDGIVNSIDAAIVRAHMGYTNYPAADLNQDGIVNGLDYSLLVRSWFKKH